MHLRCSDRPLRFIPTASAILLLTLTASCGQPQQRALEPATIKLIAFNDFHGYINPPTSRTRVPDPQGGEKPLELPTGGVSYLSSLIARLKAQNDRNAVIAAGDLIGGAPLVSSLFHHEPAIELLSMAGLEFSSVGNHEFDRGRRELLRMQNGGCAEGEGRDSCRNGRFSGAQFRYLAANVIDRQTGKSLMPGYATKEFELQGGRHVAIAFIGLVVKDTPSAVIGSGIVGLDFTDEANAANALIPELRGRGVEAIVALIHEGGTTAGNVFDDATCPDFQGRIKDIVERLDPAIDLIVSGHTHRAYVCRHAGRLITSAGSEGRFVTDIDVTIDPATRDVVRIAARQMAAVNDTAANPLPARYPTLSADARLSPLVDFYNQQVAPLAQREVGKIVADITRRVSPAGESDLGNLIADAQLAATRAAGRGGAQIALMNKGGIRADLRADRGHITYNDVFSVHPFGNTLVTLTLSGAQIDALLEQQWSFPDSILQVSSGFTYEWDAAAPIGRRIDMASIRLNGAPIDPTAKYRVTVNNFLSLGGDGYTVLLNASDPVAGVVDVEALEQYLAERSPVRAPQGNRIVRRN